MKNPIPENSRNTIYFILIIIGTFQMVVSPLFDLLQFQEGLPLANSVFGAIAIIAGIIAKANLTHDVEVVNGRHKAE